MTERTQINHVARRYHFPFGRWERFECDLPGWPDIYYVQRGVSGWCESKLIPASGACPATFTREQLMWGEAEVAAGGRWHLMGLRLSNPKEWWLLDAPLARAWFEGEPITPLVREVGSYPRKAMLDHLAPIAHHIPFIAQVVSESVA